MKRIKVTVDAQMTSCAQMRVKHSDCDYNVFQCGVDLQTKTLWTANYPHVYATSLLRLAEEVATWHIEHDNSFNRVEEIHFCDDSQAMVVSPYDWDDEEEYGAYCKAIDAAYDKCREEFLKGEKTHLRDLVFNEQTNEYEGYIEV